MKKITKITYNGGNVFKFKDTRVAVGTLPDHEDYIDKLTGNRISKEEHFLLDLGFTRQI